MKKVAFILPRMKGGGAERVAALLANEFSNNLIDVSFFLTHSRSDEVIRCDLDDKIPLVLFSEQMPQKRIKDRLKAGSLQAISTLLSKPFEILKRPVPADFAKLSILGQYGREIRFLREMLLEQPDLTIIAFLQPAIPIALLAAKDLPNRVIISERGNPHRLMKKRYGKKFIERYYTRADTVVFQTQEAKETYPTVVSEKGCVIPNPIKPDLPEPYHGDRNKFITTFCRLSKQKNLPLLIDAFALLHKEYADYKLRIIGDAPNVEGIEVLDTIKKMIVNYGFQDSVIFEPFNANVHESIIKDAMYVNSSDYEGISNAMLEAMAIGMPVICTDCPVGGARATIPNGENGLLVPMNDPNAMYRAMKKVIDDEDYAKSLSYRAVKLRESLSLKAIADRWLELV